MREHDGLLLVVHGVRREEQSPRGTSVRRDRRTSRRRPSCSLHRRGALRALTRRFISAATASWATTRQARTGLAARRWWLGPARPRRRSGPRSSSLRTCSCREGPLDSGSPRMPCSGSRPGTQGRTPSTRAFARRCSPNDESSSWSTRCITTPTGPETRWPRGSGRWRTPRWTGVPKLRSWRQRFGRRLRSGKRLVRVTRWQDVGPTNTRFDKIKSCMRAHFSRSTWQQAISSSRWRPPCTSCCARPWGPVPASWIVPGEHGSRSTVEKRSTSLPWTSGASTRGSSCRILRTATTRCVSSGSWQRVSSTRRAATRISESGQSLVVSSSVRAVSTTLGYMHLADGEKERAIRLLDDRPLPPVEEMHDAVNDAAPADDARCVATAT